MTIVIRILIGAAAAGALLPAVKLDGLERQARADAERARSLPSGLLQPADPAASGRVKAPSSGCLIRKRGSAAAFSRLFYFSLT